MESLEEFTGSNDHSPIIKGKRTKRQRPSSPHGAAVTTSTSSTGGGDGGSGGGSGASGVIGGGGGGGGDVCSSIPSPTTSGEILSTSTEEDEDMANCLILLAQGLVRPTQLVPENEDEVEENKNGKSTKTTIGKSEFYVYECKTCNRTFPSFQALGGHRASHKKPKAAIHGEEKRVFPITPTWVVEEEEEEVEKINKVSSILPPLQMVSANGTKSTPHLNNKPKVHECSICGSEFSSGQALGGHMRRHRAPPNTRIPMTVDSSSMVESEEELGSSKRRNILSLDLNLPAPPEDDHHHHHHHHQRDSKFEFTPNKQHLVFSAPALVDCHY